MGIRRPLIWITCPPAAQLLKYFPERPLVYQRTDRWECFPGCDPDQIRAYHARLSAAATVTLFCSRLLLEEEAAACCDPLFVDHGVDFEAFVSAGDGQTPEPADMAGIPRPRVGFIGGIDSHTFDPELFLAVARKLPDAQFVLIGSSSLPADWCQLSNVTLLGQKPYEQVPAYMAACDVLIMPWNRNRWIQACNPVKLKEYLAVGRPVVSTDFAELKHYPAVRTANDAEAFAAQISEALVEGCDVAAQREQVRGHTWAAKSEQVIRALKRNGWAMAGDAPLGRGSSAADESIEQCQARYLT
jgi:glycosyltransferase involved in cell wall biosynthesis